MDVREFDPCLLHEAMDRVRAERGIPWKTVAQEIGLSQSILVRVAQGRTPSVDSLVMILAWLDTTDLGRFLRQRKPRWSKPPCR